MPAHHRRTPPPLRSGASAHLTARLEAGPGVPAPGLHFQTAPPRSPYPLFLYLPRVSSPQVLASVCEHRALSRPSFQPGNRKPTRQIPAVKGNSHLHHQCFCEVRYNSCFSLCALCTVRWAKLARLPKPAHFRPETVASTADNNWQRAEDGFCLCSLFAHLWPCVRWSPDTPDKNQNRVPLKRPRPRPRC